MNKKVLLTGASGFLGRYIYKSLIGAGYDVDTAGRDSSNTIVCDLGIDVPKLTTGYMAVIHAAGKAHIVPKTEEQKKDFFTVNLDGTKYLLAAIDKTGNYPQTFVFISTIGVYGLSTGENIDETHPLQASDPYGQSKIQAETLVKEWCTKNKVNYFSIRLPLIGGG